MIRIFSSLCNFFSFSELRVLDLLTLEDFFGVDLRFLLLVTHPFFDASDLFLDSADLVVFFCGLFIVFLISTY